MPRPLNIILFTFGHAGINAIRSLRSAGHTITTCFTHPATQSWLPSVEAECQRTGIPCSTTTDPTPVTQADVVLSIFYRRKITPAARAVGTLGAFNVAASQLPRYPGYFPYRWAILNNESIWGVTVHEMTENFCQGPTLHRKSLVIKPQENAYDLSLRVADLAATAAVEAINNLASGNDQLTPIAPPAFTFFNHELPFAGQIDWRQSAAKIDSFIRALDFGRQVQNTYQHFTPPAQATINHQSIGIFRAHFGGTMSSYPPGTITRCDNQVWVQAGRGHIVIERVCVDGSDYAAPEFFATRGLAPGDMFDRSQAWSSIQAHSEISHAA